MSHLERAESVRATVRSVALSAAPAHAAEQRPAYRAGGPRSPSVSVVHHKRVHRGSRIRVNASAGTLVEQERRHPFLRRDEDAVALPLQMPAPGVSAHAVTDPRRNAARGDALPRPLRRPKGRQHRFRLSRARSSIPPDPAACTDDALPFSGGCERIDHQIGDACPSVQGHLARDAR
jgi:hypothetical protein